MRRFRIAEEPPPGPNDAQPEDACPGCGNRDADTLVWQEDDEVVCAKCGTRYRPLS